MRWGFSACAVLIRRNNLMTSAAEKNTTAGSAAPLNKKIGIGMAVFAVIEAVVTFFLVMKPLYIDPVYAQCLEYNNEGKACIVKLFGKTFASSAEIEQNQIILSLWDTIVNIALIYLVITGILLVLAFCFYKGFAFAKSYLIAVFGAKTLIALVPLLIPYANFRNSMRIFGIADAVICLALCAFCVYESSDEYADDMLLSAESRSAMWKRGITGGAMFLAMTAMVVFTHFAMSAYGSVTLLGGNWTIIIGGWKDTAIAQGVVLMILLGVALIASILYVRDGEWAMLYYFSFGTSVALTNIVAIVLRAMWVVKMYNPIKACSKSGDVAAFAEKFAGKKFDPFSIAWLYGGNNEVEKGIDIEKVNSWIGSNGMSTRWWIATVFLVLSCLSAAAIAVFAFTKLRRKFSFKISEHEKKPALAVLIGIGSIILSFALTMAAVLIYDRQVYTFLQLGAMDYMYIIAYGGITVFLAAAMWCGYSFSKMGTVALYVLIASNNFSSIFGVFNSRSIAVQNSIAQREADIEQGLEVLTPIFKGYNYIASGIFYILSVIACLGILAVFIVKEVKDYMYQKRYS